MRIIVLGAGGMLGRDLVLELASDYEVLAWSRAEADVTDALALSRRIQEARPDLLINCAAATDVDRCEREPEWAYRINAEGARNAAEAARAVGAGLVHVSTDFVFSGEADREYGETDPPDGPVNAYGASKLAGEREVLAAYPDAKVVRTEWLYGRWGRSFPRAILNAALRDPERELRVVADQWGAPTYTRHVARALPHFFAAPGGRAYHLTNAGSCSRYEWAVEALRLAGLGQVRVTPIRAEEWTAPARRPRRTILRRDYLRETGQDDVPDWRAALAEFVAELRAAGELELEQPGNA